VPNERTDISCLIAAWSAGDEEALKALVSEVYPEIRCLARQHLGKRSLDHTLESVGLANEAFLRLARARGIQCTSRVHFFALCAQVIRRISVDYARKRKYAKRGGGAPHLPLEPDLAAVMPRSVAVEALDDALTALAKLDPRKSQVVELRYFGGLSLDECAEVLGVSPQTVMRDWNMAKVWLYRELFSA